MYCPTCGSEYRDDVTECADCKVALVTLAPGEVPRRVRGPLFPTIPTTPKRPDDRPWFIKAVPWLALFVGAVAVLSSLLSLAPGSLHETISRVTSGGSFSMTIHSSHDGMPPLAGALAWAGVAVLTFLIAFSFWRKLPWSRHLLTFALIADAVRQSVVNPQEVLKNTVSVMGVIDTRIPSMVVTLGLVVWYFYFKPNVRAYFRRLESREGSFEPQTAP